MLSNSNLAAELDALAFKTSESDVQQHASARLEAYQTAWQHLDVAMQACDESVTSSGSLMCR